MTVVVVGAGGLGCPALLALAEAGVGRLVVLDPDRVEVSNLPRQILYRAEDIGREKAQVAAERVQQGGVDVVGVSARLDDTNEERVLHGADVILDATDGALTKDWLNALAVRKGLPLVHAAAIRSEGRLLVVPPGGQPCLACIFGRLDRAGEACADHGVWGGVVGATGFLAAAATLDVLEGRGRERAACYQMLDVGGGRQHALRLQAEPGCPVCGVAATRASEPYPVDVARCDRDSEAALPEVQGEVLDLRAERCPMNLLRARRAVESLGSGRSLLIRLGVEGRDSVPDGLRALGHELVATQSESRGLDLVVRRGVTSSGGLLSRDHLLRFSRQVVLPELGEEGQQKILEARVLLTGRGAAFETAAIYLEAAGLGHLDLRRADADAAGEVGGGSGHPARMIRLADLADVAHCGLGGRGKALRRAQGALLADRLLREVVGVAAPPAT